MRRISVALPNRRNTVDIHVRWRRNARRRREMAGMTGTNVTRARRGRSQHARPRFKSTDGTDHFFPAFVVPDKAELLHLGDDTKILQRVDALDILDHPRAAVIAGQTE